MQSLSVCIYIYIYYISSFLNTELKIKTHYFNSNARHTNVVKLLGDPWLKDSKWNIPLEFITGEDLETTIFKVQLSKIQVKMCDTALIILSSFSSSLYQDLYDGLCTLFHVASDMRTDD